MYIKSEVERYTKTLPNGDHMVFQMKDQAYWCLHSLAGSQLNPLVQLQRCIHAIPASGAIPQYLKLFWVKGFPNCNDLSHTVLLKTVNFVLCILDEILIKIKS